jgi:argininosuccinate lyase
MKLWQKDKASLKEVETFTVGKDREMDMYLAAFDVLGSLAHTIMLENAGLLTKEDLEVLKIELKKIYQEYTRRQFFFTR